MYEILGKSIHNLVPDRASKEIEKEMEVDEFTLKYLGISARILQHWAEQGLLPDKVRGADENHRFNFLDLVWIKTVVELRLLGLSLEKIRKAKESLLKEQTLADLLGIKEESFKKQISFLKIYSLGFIISRVQSTIRVFNDGQAFISAEEMDHDPILKKLINTHSHISIPLIAIFQQLLADVRYYDSLSRLTFFNAKERQIIELIRKGDAKTLTINFKNGKPIMVEVTKTENILAESRLSDILLKRGYEEIVVSTQDGSITFSARTTKHKLK